MTVGRALPFALLAGLIALAVSIVCITPARSQDPEIVYEPSPPVAGRTFTVHFQPGTTISEPNLHYQICQGELCRMWMEMNMTATNGRYSADIALPSDATEIAIYITYTTENGSGERTDTLHIEVMAGSASGTGEGNETVPGSNDTGEEAERNATDGAGKPDLCLLTSMAASIVVVLTLLSAVLVGTLMVRSRTAER